MAFFSRFFRSTESIARESVQVNRDLIKEWQQYVQTVPEKKNIADNFPIDTLRLRELTKTGIEFTVSEERDEKQIIRNLKSISHRDRIKRIHGLEQLFDHALTKYRYVYELLKQIYFLLQIELHLTTTLEKSQNRKLAKYLQEQISVELIVLKKINEMNKREGPDTLTILFSELIRGEATIKVLDEVAKRQFKKMQKLFSNEIPTSIIYQWVERVLNSLEIRVQKAMDDELIVHHPNADLEFINSSLFVDLVRDSIKSLKTRGKVSERMISIFVEDFRLGYNQRWVN